MNYKRAVHTTMFCNERPTWLFAVCGHADHARRSQP